DRPRPRPRTRSVRRSRADRVRDLEPGHGSAAAFGRAQPAGDRDPRDRRGHAIPRRLAGRAAAAQRTHQHLRALRPSPGRFGDVRFRPGARPRAHRAVTGDAVGRGSPDRRLRFRVRARHEARRRAARAQSEHACAGAGGAARAAVRGRACVLALVLAAASSALAGSDVKVDDLVRVVVDESTNYKMRVQAALVLGKLADPRAVQPLIKALNDQNKTVRGIAASALGQLGDQSALEPLREMVKRDSDPFARGQAEKAIAALSAGGGGAPKRGAKVYVNFGAFAGGVKSAGPEAAKI